MGQTDFFGAAKAEDIRLPADAVWTPTERLQREHAAIGFYLSSHPLDDFADSLKAMSVPLWRDYPQAHRIGAGSRLAGVIVSRQERRTRTGGRIAIVQLSDPSGQFEAIVFSDTLDACRDRLEPGSCVLCTVSAQEREEGLSVRIQNVELLEKVSASERQLTVFLDLDRPITAIDKLVASPGTCEVRFVCLIDQGRTEVEVRLERRREVSRSVASAIRAMPGVVDVQFSEQAARRSHAA